MKTSSGSRQSPRVILRTAIGAQFDDIPVLVVELGLGGAKCEHGERLEIGRRGTLACGTLTAQAEVRHSILLPTEHGFVYHTGLSFAGLDATQSARFFKLVIEEAQEQVKEWEANLGGVGWNPSVIRRSAVARRFIALHLTPEGWQRGISSDPNQPLDGVTVIDDTPKDEIEVLCSTYHDGDDATRELLRRMAMLAILERLRQ